MGITKICPLFRVRVQWMVFRVLVGIYRLGCSGPVPYTIRTQSTMSSSFKPSRRSSPESIDVAAVRAASPNVWIEDPRYESSPRISRFDRKLKEAGYPKVSEVSDQIGRLVSGLMKIVDQSRFLEWSPHRDVFRLARVHHGGLGLVGGHPGIPTTAGAERQFFR